MRLKTVLKVKELEHNRLKLELSDKNREVVTLNEKKSNINTDIKKQIFLLDNNSDISDRLQISSIIEDLRYKEIKIENELKSIYDKIQSIQDDIKIVKQEIRSIEKVIENKIKKIQKEVLRKQQNALDELNLN